MRLLIISLMAVAVVSGCRTTTAPESTVINVRVRDDRGEPVNRTPVSVTMSATRIDTRTGSDGTIDIRVPNAGMYSVRVIPREGYVGGTQSLAKSVNVTENARASVDFTLNRAGVSTAEPTRVDW